VNLPIKLYTAYRVG